MKALSNSAPLRDPFAGPWLSAKNAAAYVNCASVKAWYEWRKRHGIVKRANGTVAKADLDRELSRVRPHGGGGAKHPHSLANLTKAKPRRAAITPAETQHVA